MAKSIALEADFVLRRRELRKRVLRMLVRISRKRNECFNFSNNIQPCFYAAAVRATPPLQRKSNLHGVEQRDVEDAHEPVVTRVIEISESVEAADTNRRRQTVGEKPRLKLLEHGRIKLFNFDAM